MGGHIGKFSYSYSMSEGATRDDRDSGSKGKGGKKSSTQDDAVPGPSRLMMKGRSSTEKNRLVKVEEPGGIDFLEPPASPKDLKETLCVSWRTKSDTWSSKCKKKPMNKAKAEIFATKRTRKWTGSFRRMKQREESPHKESTSCVCTMYRKTNFEHGSPARASTSRSRSSGSRPSNVNTPVPVPVPVPTSAHPFIDLTKFNPADYPIDDEEEIMRRQRAKEMAEGVDLNILMGNLGIQDNSILSYPAHSQVDYVHYLVPDLKEITNCSFYWGKIDRYEAEKLLDKKPEGTFLLRDSAQEEYLFSVSFRRYGRSLHARIEQWNGQFSFDSHDPSVFSSKTVTGLIEHYKDPASCMFFEPMLTTRLHRTFPFDLQHLARAALCSRVTYDSINRLNLPKSLKLYCKEYHYKQRVRIRRLE